MKLLILLHLFWFAQTCPFASHKCAIVMLPLSLLKYWFPMRIPILTHYLQTEKYVSEKKSYFPTLCSESKATCKCNIKFMSSYFNPNFRSRETETQKGDNAAFKEPCSSGPRGWEHGILREGFCWSVSGRALSWVHPVLSLSSLEPASWPIIPLAALSSPLLPFHLPCCPFISLPEGHLWPFKRYT